MIFPAGIIKQIQGTGEPESYIMVLRDEKTKSQKEVCVREIANVCLCVCVCDVPLSGDI